MTVSPQFVPPHPLRVEVAGARVGLDLADALGRRGLVGRLVRRERHWEVEFASAHERPEWLRAEVLQALEDWLADRHLDEAIVHVGDEVFVARAAAVVHAAP